MIEATLTFGVIIFVGLAAILIKLPTRSMLWLLGRALWLDVFVTVFALVIHWGTMTGLMAAAVAGLMCSATTTVARWAVGYTRSGKYYPGLFKLKVTR
jgi:hypothetical protein